MVRQVFAQQSMVENTVAKEIDIAGTVSNVATKVYQEREKSKYISNSTNAQVELNTLSNKYKFDNSNDPYGNLDDYKAERDAIFEKYGDQIAPMYRADFYNKKTQMVGQDDVNFETWATKQNVQNIGTDISNVMKADMNMANTDGIAYGSGETDDVNTLMKYQTNFQNIEEIGAGVLNEQQMGSVRQEYAQKYLTNFIDGVITSNPLKAKELLEDPTIKGSLTQENHTRLSKAANTRFNNLGKIKAENDILNSLKNGNNLIAESMNRNLSMEEIEEAATAGNLNKQAKNVLYKMNGFTATERPKNTPETRAQIAQGGMQVRDELTAFTSKKEKSAKDYQDMSNKIYDAMDKGYLTIKQGNQMLTTFVGDYADQYQTEMENYNNDVLKIDTDIGYAGIEKFYDEKVDASRNWFFDEDTDVQIANSNNKIKLYDMYTYSLNEEAGAMGMTIAELSQQDAQVKQKVLTRAFESAKMLYASGVSGREIRDAIEADNIIADNTQKEIRVNSQAAIDKVYAEPTTPVELNKEDSDFLNNL